ncbi:MaoC family dehydratase [Loigolactobacillus bifermentans]|uniref:Crotonase n=1 Tax=Loigolactobacillus bifermentans DSM 20003 TaxID=1423726 RepID=A0A0R1GNJ1_9LACO|nr:MaoC family dehydratase [Loigolactobacillus bifermentans]KRK32898.1 crotonase [Loigolactobacillus bifermentans DSM 20003]
MTKQYDIIYEDQLEVGMKDTLSKKITAADVDKFVEVTGDRNPMHTDDEFAKATQFGGRIAHGMISAGLISAVLGMKIPGPGAIYLGQTLTFKAPVHFDDVLSATAEVVQIDQKKKFKIATLDTKVVNQKGQVVTEGTATIIPAQR